MLERAVGRADRQARDELGSVAERVRRLAHHCDEQARRRAIVVREPRAVDLHEPRGGQAKRVELAPHHRDAALPAAGRVVARDRERLDQRLADRVVAVLEEAPHHVGERPALEREQLVRRVRYVGAPHAALHLDPDRGELHLEHARRIAGRIEHAALERALGAARERTAHHHLLAAAVERAPVDDEPLARAGARVVRDPEVGERRIDRDPHRLAVRAAARYRDRVGAVVGHQRADRCQIGARGGRLPARVPALAVEQRVVDHEVALHAPHAEPVEVGGEPPVVLGGQARVAAAAHVERADRALRVGRGVRGHARRERVRGSEPVQRGERGDDLQVRRGHERRVGAAFEHDAPVCVVDHERAHARVLQRARLERAPERLGERGVGSGLGRAQRKTRGEQRSPEHELAQQLARQHTDPRRGWD